MLAYPPAEINLPGERFLLGFDTQDAKGRLEAIVAAKVMEQAYEAADHMKPATAERHLREVSKRISSNYYATMAEGWQAEVLSASGTMLFFLSLLQEHHSELTAVDAQRIYNVDPVGCNHAIATVTPDFFAAALKQMGATEAEVKKVMSSPEMKEGLAALVGGDDEEEAEEGTPLEVPATSSTSSESTKP